MKEEKTLTRKKPSKNDVKEVVKKLKKDLGMEYDNLWDVVSKDDKEFAWSFAEDYKNFLDLAKTKENLLL
jgi:hypothetical protein